MILEANLSLQINIFYVSLMKPLRENIENIGSFYIKCFWNKIHVLELIFDEYKIKNKISLNNQNIWQIDL